MGSNRARGQNHKEPHLGILARVKAGALAIAIFFLLIIGLLCVLGIIGLSIIGDPFLRLKARLKRLKMLCR